MCVVKTEDELAKMPGPILNVPKPRSFFRANHESFYWFKESLQTLLAISISQNRRRPDQERRGVVSDGILAHLWADSPSLWTKETSKALISFRYVKERLQAWKFFDAGICLKAARFSLQSSAQTKNTFCRLEYCRSLFDSFWLLSLFLKDHSCVSFISVGFL